MSAERKPERSLRRVWLSTLVALGLGLCGVGAEAQTPANPATASAQRVVSVGGALTEIVYALGGEQSLVAVDTTSLYPEAALRLPKVGYMRQLSAEGVLSMRPTLLLATNEAGPANVLAQLREAKVNIQTVSADHSFDELRNKVRVVAAALGRDAAGKALEAKLAQEMQDAQRYVAQQRSKPRVLFILSHSGTPQVAGEGTAADAFIRLTGSSNVLAGVQGYKPMTTEAIVAALPDVILTTTQGITALGGIDKLWQQPGLALTAAGKHKRVVAMDALYLIGFGPRLPAAVREAAERLRGDAADGRKTAAG